MSLHLDKWRISFNDWTFSVNSNAQMMADLHTLWNGSSIHKYEDQQTYEELSIDLSSVSVSDVMCDLYSVKYLVPFCAAN